MPHYAEGGQDEQTQGIEAVGSCFEWSRRYHCLRKTRRVCRIEDCVWHVHEKCQYSLIIWLELLAKHSQRDNQTTEHLIGILASLLRLLPGGSAARIRILAKFVEKDYEKIDKILKLRKQYAAQVQAVDRGIKEEQGTSNAKAEDMADRWLSRRLDAGLFCLQVGVVPDLLGVYC